LSDLGTRLVQIAGNDGVFRANDDARGFNADLYPVRAIVTFGGSVGIRVDIKRIVGAGLGTSFAPDAPLVIEIDNPVRSSIQGADRANLHARGVCAVIATVDSEEPTSVRIDAFFDVLYPGTVHTQGNIVFRLASDRTGMAADTFAVVDEEAVIHGSSDPNPQPLSLHRQVLVVPVEHPSFKV
jgi:hypothetical protein